MNRPRKTKTTRPSRERAPLGQAGFSLLQTLVTMALMSTITAIAQPTVVDVLQAYELRSASRQLYGELQRARTQAVMRNTRTRVTVSNGSGLLLERYDLDSDSWETQPSDNDWSRATHAITAGGTGTVEFQADGTASQSGTIWMQTGSGSILYLYTSPAGRIKIL